MKCLILAAGKGSRLSPKGDAKPLKPLMGLPLLKRAILTSAAAGCDDFYIVTGYRSKDIEIFIAQHCLRQNIKITCLKNEEWATRGNGISVLKGEGIINNTFLLIMADHLFEETLLEKLVNSEIKQNEVILAVDKNISNNSNIDLDDVTKVYYDKEKIKQIGKELTNFNAYDTGAFLCTPNVFKAIRESSNNGDTSLSGGIKILAKKGQAKYLDSSNFYWLDIDTAKDFKNAKKLLKKSLYKPHDGFIARVINRKISLYVLTPLLLKLFRNITPNQVTIISLLIGINASILLFLKKPLMAGICIQLASIFDGCDGEIARLKKMQSDFGKFFDAVVDRFIDTVFFFGMFYFVFTNYQTYKDFSFFFTIATVVITLLAITGNLLVSYTSAKSISDLGYSYQGRLIAAGRGRDLRIFFVFLGCGVAHFYPLSIIITLTLIALLTNTIVIRRIFLSWRYNLTKDSMISHKKKAVIFDFDGTVANTMPFLTKLAVNLISKNYALSKNKALKIYIETTGLSFEEHIAKNLNKFKKLINEKSFKKVYGKIHGEKNKRIQNEFDAASKLEPLIFNKTFYYFTKWPAKYLLNENLIKQIDEAYRVGKKLNMFLYN